MGGRELQQCIGIRDPDPALGWHRLVARVRIPPTSVFDIIRTISQNLALYEQKFGPIRTPGAEAPLYPPEDGPGAEPQE